MNDQTQVSTVEAPDGSAPAGRQALSKRQIKAAELANERLVRQRWKDLLANARTFWPKVPAEDLAKVNGNVHALAGLVQLRYHTNRQDADLQVQQFFLANMSTPRTEAGGIRGQAA